MHGFLTLSSRGRGEVQKLPKFANSSTDRLREMRIKGGGGLESRKFCGRTLLKPPNCSCSQQENMVFSLKAYFDESLGKYQFVNREERYERNLREKGSREKF